jgi:hypothetical protein
MSVDLNAKFKEFVGKNTLSPTLLLEAASHLVECLKDSGLSDMEKNQLVFSTVFKHVQTFEMTSCLPVSLRSLFSSFPLSSLLCKKVDAISPSSNAVVALQKEPTELPVVTVREPESENK